MLCMRGHVSVGFFRCDYTTKSIKICYLFTKFTLCICNNMTKTIVFTLQE